MSRTQTKVSSNEQRSIVSKYNKGAGLVSLATDCGYSIPVIRRVLTEQKVSIRGRGRPVTA